MIGPVVPIDEIRSPNDRFACVPLSCRLTAESCLQRQTLTRDRGQKQTVCFNCPDGIRVAGKLGGILPIIRPEDRKTYNWAFGGFRNPRAADASRSKEETPTMTTTAPQRCRNAPTCTRWLRPGKLKGPVPDGTEGLCNECRKKEVRRQRKGKGSVPLPPSRTSARPPPTIHKHASPPPELTGGKPPSVPPAPAIPVITAPTLVVDPPRSKTREDLTMREILEYAELVETVGVELVRDLARRIRKAS